MPETKKTADFKLRYPNGLFHYDPLSSDAERRERIEKIKTFPQRLSAQLETLSQEILAKKYRPGGWTGRQVIHHIADSHMNAIIRFKLALTEETPSIKPYDEKAWAELSDVSETPVEVSVELLRALHQRWGKLLDSLRRDDWKRALFHPEQRRSITLDEMLALYAWHGDHHLAHLRLLQ